MFGVKKKQIIENKEKKITHVLKLNCKNYTTTYVNSKPQKSHILSFKSFIRWYFSKPESKEYLFVYDKGATLHKRDDIINFEIFTEEQ